MKWKRARAAFAKCSGGKQKPRLRPRAVRLVRSLRVSTAALRAAHRAAVVSLGICGLARKEILAICTAEEWIFGRVGIG